jgi:UDP-N-acetylmuramoyl-tripeptide--D-alanyl-D-alanine ligase
LTGSNGKTTTKELFQAVLEKKYTTKATVGNLNNHIGVPLTLLSFTKETEIGIVEMGANHQKKLNFCVI